MKRTNYLVAVFLFCLSSAGCAGSRDNSNTTVTTTVPAPPIQTLRAASRPQGIVDQMKARGEQEQAEPVLKIVSPINGSTVTGATVPIRLELSGDLQSYQPHRDPTTGAGNHIHIILDDNPYEAYYDLNTPFELKNVTAGKHVLRVFASRPWHESYKNAGSFQMIVFNVKGGGDTSKPTTTGAGQMMANNQMSAVEVDEAKPLLTYSRPKGEYKGADAETIMIDFWLTNAKLKGDGGEYRVRYIIDDDEPVFVDKWEPLWLAGWINGKHTVRLELIGPDGYPFKNGSFNITTREITVVK